MARKELENVLDYIMNRADETEFEVILKACQRRATDKPLLGKINGLGPGETSRRMADQVQEKMGYSLEGIRTTVRGFVEDIIRKNAPEVTEAELAELMEAYVPDPAKAAAKPSPVSKLPPEALLSMVRQFVEYSEGRMAPSRQREIWERMPRWQDEYWAAFPGELKALIKGYLEGRLDGDSFGKAVLSILGL